ncbi:DUF192 domain-containing protein [Shewanella zhangzhouensis]|uniref:DUF192 domain-containing protein n=1 Tax=Shewanella zhangzhouensis TaxID=2864213 RepID=UPI001C659B98|nr:DUF192 domain-containing protein [Shewanella zhangzhouensis]QYK06001.1 DUF192 domain-containing protein [Shewanella zhangzhouensis]
MKRVHFTHTHSGAALQVWLANTPWLRLRGLLGRPQLAANEAMLINRCGSVHTCWMGYALDLVFLDRELRVLKTTEQLRPWRSASCVGAFQVMELAPGAVAAMQVRVGDNFQWIK